MWTVSLRWSGRLGHFRRAEANRDAFTYPVPPRTAVLGLLGAVLGLGKDEAPAHLAGVRIARAGDPPRRFWHKVKLRKDPPAPLPQKLRRSSKGTTKPERATLMAFELLWNPDFRIDVGFPGGARPLGEELAERLRTRRWHFTPCLGLSELLAELDLVEVADAVPLAVGRHLVEGVIPAGSARILPPEPGERKRLVELLRMPARVDERRRFAHESYYLDARGDAVPVETNEAWSLPGRAVIFE